MPVVARRTVNLLTAGVVALGASVVISKALRARKVQGANAKAERKELNRHRKYWLQQDAVDNDDEEMKFDDRDNEDVVDPMYTGNNEGGGRESESTKILNESADQAIGDQTLMEEQLRGEVSSVVDTSLK